MNSTGFTVSTAYNFHTPHFCVFPTSKPLQISTWRTHCTGLLTQKTPLCIHKSIHTRQFNTQRVGRKVDLGLSRSPSAARRKIQCGLWLNHCMRFWCAVFFMCAECQLNATRVLHTTTFFVFQLLAFFELSDAEQGAVVEPAHRLEEKNDLSQNISPYHPETSRTHTSPWATTL